VEDPSKAAPPRVTNLGMRHSAVVHECLFDFEFLRPGPLSNSCSRGIGIPHNCTKRRSIELEKIVPPEGITIVPHIYAPSFVTLVLVESIVGAYMQVLTFYLANTPPLVVDVYIGTLYY